MTELEMIQDAAITGLKKEVGKYRAELRRLREAQRWRVVGDAPFNTIIIGRWGDSVAPASQVAPEASARGLHGWWRCSGSGWSKVGEPDGWMPLPEGPGGEE